MMGPHDLGGRAGFGPVLPEEDEPIFHADWEKRALGLTLCCGALGYWGIDASRHARESLHPVTYYGSSYYAIWITALTALLIRHGEVSEAELASGKALAPGKRSDSKMQAAAVADVLAKGAPADRDITAPAAFAMGDRVRLSKLSPRGHTRLPGYARGKIGVVTKVHGTHVFPDAAAHGQGEQPTWLYTISIAGTELWGATAEPCTTVRLDAWERYLEPA
ncbi:nitrile hydratase subunit beta [Actibacterium sp. 188UL27-1]|uniref:nitrile hydratase subunit beta n=1 Tax=Actibacterium sp. 188UL27-1 TaxID=2786961 RepID=UPI00195ED307|nr:nitrile hydratase subunit beta [Actibacterium sp. 188UL27-1]MBM7068773.1 nitrile hydratase subunit beta [Actibacterium sp. 188UL27-1]